MDSIQALREQRDAEAKKLHALVSPEREWNDDADTAIYDQGMAAIADYDAKIERIRKVNELAASTMLNNSVFDASERNLRDKGGDEQAHQLFQNWLRGGEKAVKDEDWKILRNTMSTTTPGEGGFTVATAVASTVIDALKAFGGMRDVATVLKTAQGNPMNYPTSNGTAENGELIAENASATQADPTFGSIPLNVFKFGSRVVKVPIELLQDSSIDIEGFVVNRLGQRLGRITNQMFTTGTGTGQPNGLVTAALSGKVGLTGQTVTILYDDLVDLQHSVDPSYRQGGKAGFMMNDGSLRVIRKIKDSQGRPIFVPGYETGMPGGLPDTLLGSPLTINQDVAAMAANAKSVLFGDFSQYIIRDAMEMQMFRFYDSPYITAGQVGFLAWMRAGGNLADQTGAVKFYQNSAT